MTSHIKTVLAPVALIVLLAPLLAMRSQTQAAPQTPAIEMQQRVTGAATFRTYCASCHGVEGRGDGPLATSMRRRPANLAEIAKRNGGEYPSEMVFRTIDGRQPIRGHGGPDMPVWGDVFLKSREGGDATTVRQTIESLVRHIESIQIKPAH